MSMSQLIWKGGTLTIFTSDLARDLSFLLLSTDTHHITQIMMQSVQQLRFLRMTSSSYSSQWKGKNDNIGIFMNKTVSGESWILSTFMPLPWIMYQRRHRLYLYDNFYSLNNKSKATLVFNLLNGYRSKHTNKKTTFSPITTFV